MGFDRVNSYAEKMTTEDILDCFNFDKEFVNDLYQDIVLIQNKIAELANKRNNPESETKKNGKKLSSININSTFTVLKDVTDNNINEPKALQIKKEKISTTLKETENLMPAPKVPPLRKRKEAKLNDGELPRRSSRMKKSCVKESISNDSVIIQNSTITTIDLSNQKESPVQRITRSKMKIKSTIPNKGEEENNEKNEEFSLKKLEMNQSDKKSKCENEPIEQEQPKEKLIPSGKKIPIFSPYNKTPLRQKEMVFEKLNSKWASSTETQSSNVILSASAQKMSKANQNEQEQQSEAQCLSELKEKEIEKTSEVQKLEERYNKSMAENEEKDKRKKEDVERKLIPSGKKTPIFSPYSRTPLRQKVMAFEKLNNKSVSQTQPQSPNIILSANAQKMLKSSQKDLRQRERLKMEREQEAAKKKEALLKSLAEKNKQKNAEKQSKAQQVRELKEKEIEKKLEVQKLKEERYNKSMAEKEEKEKRKKEEMEKKRVLVKKRAEEQRKLESAGQSAKKPIYLITPLPLLPTSDCYDSDDEGFKSNKKVPSWMRSSPLHENQLVAQTVGEMLKNSLFCVHHQTINLKEVFEDIDVKKLRRNSSAIWKKPPRYTNIHNVIFSEDEESD